MSRKKARDMAFKLIFEIPFHENNYKRIIEEFLSDQASSGKDIDYIKTVVLSCFSNVEIIDAKIESGLKNWTIKRLPKITIAILRLAVTEMLYLTDIPYQVVINEAVELAKTYGDDETPAFINGVLASFINKK